MSKPKIAPSVQVKVSELVNAMRSGALGRLLNCPKPVKVSWDNRHMVGSCNAEHQAFEDQRIALCKKWGHIDEETHDYAFDTEEAVEGFKREYDVLTSQVVSLAGRRVKVSDLRGDMSEVDLCELEAFLEE